MHLPKNENCFLKEASKEIVIWKRASAKVQERPDEQQVDLKNRKDPEGSWLSWWVGAAAQPCFRVEQDWGSK